MFGRPYLTLSFDLENCAHYLFVNGALISNSAVRHPLTETQPVNQFLRTAENVIEIWIYKTADRTMPPADWTVREGTKGKIVLRTRQAGDDEKTDQDVAVLAFDFPTAGNTPSTAGTSAAGRFDSARQMATSASGDIVIGPPVVGPLAGDRHIKVSLAVTLPVKFPEWAFLRSENTGVSSVMPPDQAMKVYSELLAAYEVVWRKLQAKDVEGTLTFFDERSREMDRAYYRPDGTTRAELRQWLKDTFADDDVTLAPIRPTVEGNLWQFQFGPTGTLLALTQARAQGGAILRFKPKKEDDLYSPVLPTLWRRQGDTFIIAR